jgi:tetratricopeptide (TPR) repeat protein
METARTALGIGSTLTLALLVGAMPGSAQAAPKRDRSGNVTDNAPPVDQKLEAKINKAVELLNAAKYADAREVLESIDRKHASPNEVSRIEQVLAALAQLQERFGEARTHLKNAIDSGGLNDQEILSTRFQIAQMWLADEHWKEAVEALKAWMAMPGAKPNANTYYLLAVAYYQLKNFGAALEPAQKAVDMTDKPQEGWLQLLLGLHLEREEYAPSVPLLRRLLLIAPLKKAYWLQLSSAYGMMEKYPEALGTLELAYYGGLLSEPTEYRRLVDMMLNLNMPYRAAMVITKAVDDKKIEPDAKDFEKLGNCWIAARYLDKAIAPMTKAAAAADNGELYLRLAEVQTQREDWQKTIDAVNKALEKGNLKSPADAEILYGVALVNLSRLKEARPHFVRAAEGEKGRGEAQGWIRFIDNEK